MAVDLTRPGSSHLTCDPVLVLDIRQPPQKRAWALFVIEAASTWPAAAVELPLLHITLADERGNDHEITRHASIPCTMSRIPVPRPSDHGEGSSSLSFHRPPSLRSDAPLTDLTRGTIFKSRLPSPTRSVFSRQNRRVQLRAAGFRGPPHIARAAAQAGHDRAGTDELSSPERADSPAKLTENHTATKPAAMQFKLGVLGEITNNRGGTPSNAQGPIDLTQPELSPKSRCNPDQQHPDSILNDENFNRADPMMKSPVGRMSLQESGHQRKILAAHSPTSARRLKARHARRISATFPSGESTEYIGHLEAQLMTLQNQLRSLTSPTSTKLQSTKLRSLTTESRVLRQEVSAWEQKFNERVREETEVRTEIEASLRTRLRSLERELEIKDGRLMELECEVERLRKDVEVVEAVQDENLALSRRLDVLSELLTQSPTKPEVQRTVSPTLEADERRGKRRRLTLMIPRLSTSSDPVQTSKPRSADHADASALPKPVSPAPQVASSGTVENAKAEEQESSREGPPATANDDLSSFRYDLGRVEESRPPPARRISTLSDTAVSLGSPLPPAIFPRDRPAHRNRRMRRFLAGSGGPKQLILPVTSQNGSFSASASSFHQLIQDDQPTPKARRPQSAILPPSYLRRGSSILEAGLDERASAPSSRPVSLTTWDELERAFGCEGIIERLRLDAQNLMEEDGGVQSARFALDGIPSSVERPSLAPRSQSLFAELERLGGPDAAELSPRSLGRTAEPATTPGPPPPAQAEEACCSSCQTRLVDSTLPLQSRGILWLASSVLGTISRICFAPVRILRKMVTCGLCALCWVKAVAELACLVLGYVLRSGRAVDDGANEDPNRRDEAPVELARLDLTVRPRLASPGTGGVTELVTTRDASGVSSSSQATPDFHASRQLQIHRHRLANPYCLDCDDALSAGHFRCWLQHSASLVAAIISHVRDQSEMLCRVHVGGAGGHSYPYWPRRRVRRS